MTDQQDGGTNETEPAFSTPPAPPVGSSSSPIAPPAAGSIPQQPTANSPSTWYENVAIVVVALLCCWPLGLVLVWLNKKWDQKTKWIVTGLFIGLVVIVGVIGAIAGGSSSTSSKSTKSSNGSSATVTTSRAATSSTTTLPPYTPIPSDFKLDIVETSRSCFGSAGCNIQYQIDVSYVGIRSLDPSGNFTVIYSVTGGDSEKVANFTVHGSQASIRPDFISTPPNPHLVATATRIVN